MRRFITWQRNRDFLRELQIVVWIGLVILALIVILEAIDLLTGGPVTTTVPVSADDLPPLGLSRPGLTVEPPTEITVVIDNPTPRQRLLHALAQAPSALLFLTVLALLARIIHHARKTHPFTARTVNGLRWMGLVLFAGLTAAAVEGWARLLLSESVLIDHWSATMQLPLAWLFGGLLCFAVAEVVQRGVLMREELAAVI